VRESRCHQTPGRSESKGLPLCLLRGDPSLDGSRCRGGASPGRLRRALACQRPGRRTQSAHVGTRKMVTYARPGRSQGKLWWRSAAILTCKSIV